MRRQNDILKRILFKKHSCDVTFQAFLTQASGCRVVPGRAGGDSRSSLSGLGDKLKFWIQTEASLRMPPEGIWGQPASPCTHDGKLFPEVKI